MIASYWYIFGQKSSLAHGRGLINYSTMDKKAVKIDDIIKAIQDPKTMEILTAKLKPLNELVLNAMTVSLTASLEKIVDQKIAEASEILIMSTDENSMCGK